MKIRHIARHGAMGTDIRPEWAAHSEIGSFGGRWVIGGILIYWRLE